MSFKGESESEETSVVAEVSNESWLNVYVHWQQLSPACDCQFASWLDMMFVGQ